MGAIFLRFLLVCILLKPTGSEPVCSKFAYEEKLLEKMVRMEFNVGQMERDIKNTNSLVLESLERLKQEWQKVTKESEAIKTEVRKVLKKTEEEVSEEIEDLRTERVNALKEYNEKLKQLEGMISIPNIAFKARGPSSLVPVENEVIVFTKTIVNTGNAYNNATGIFTAPTNGTYLFTSQLCLAQGKHITFGIYIEDMLYTVGRFYEGNFFTCFNVETTAAMTVNQRASVKSWFASVGSVLYEEDNHRWNIFSGTLIHN